MLVAGFWQLGAGNKLMLLSIGSLAVIKKEN
jgi:hypothetical protein